MPFERLWARVVSEEQRQKDEKREWILGNWMIARAVADVLLCERAPQYHEKENPPKFGVDQARRDREALQDLQENIGDSHASPAHFGARHGFEHVFGEPPKLSKQGRSGGKRDRKFYDDIDEASTNNVINMFKAFDEART